MVKQCATVCFFLSFFCFFFFFITQQWNILSRSVSCQLTLISLGSDWGDNKQTISLFYFQWSRQKPDFSCSCAIWAGFPSAVTIHSILPNVQFHFRKKNPSFLTEYDCDFVHQSRSLLIVDGTKTPQQLQSFPCSPWHVNCCEGLQTLEAFTCATAQSQVADQQNYTKLLNMVIL